MIEERMPLPDRQFWNILDLFTNCPRLSKVIGSLYVVEEIYFPCFFTSQITCLYFQLSFFCSCFIQLNLLNLKELITVRSSCDTFHKTFILKLFIQQKQFSAANKVEIRSRNFRFFWTEKCQLIVLGVVDYQFCKII